MNWPTVPAEVRKQDPGYMGRRMLHSGIRRRRHEFGAMTAIEPFIDSSHAASKSGMLQRQQRASGKLWSRSLTQTVAGPMVPRAPAGPARVLLKCCSRHATRAQPPPTRRPRGHDRILGIYRPQPTAAFGQRETRLPGFETAAEAARTTERMAKIYAAVP